MFALEPPSSYFIGWLSREQSGFRWGHKILSNEIIIVIHANDWMLVRGGVRTNTVDGMAIETRSVSTVQYEPPMPPPAAANFCSPLASAMRTSVVSIRETIEAAF